MSTSDEVQTLVKLRFGSMPTGTAAIAAYIRALPLDFLHEYGYVIQREGYTVDSIAVFVVEPETVFEQLVNYVQKKN